MSESEEALPRGALRFREDGRGGSHERGLENPPDGGEEEGGEGPEHARQRVGAVEPAQREGRAEEDGRGEVVADGEEAVGRGDEVEEEAGVQPLQEVVGGAYRPLDDFAEGVEPVWPLGGDGVDGDGVDAVFGEDAVRGARAPEGGVLEVLDECCRARRVGV